MTGCNDNYQQPPARSHQPTASYFDEQSRNSVPERSHDQSITRTSIAPNPATSQCHLKLLDFDSMYKFTAEFIKEQNKFRDDTLLMVDYISFGCLMQLQAHDQQHNITRGQMGIRNERCNLYNNMIYHLMFLFCCPKSKQEFLGDFVRNAQTMFPKPPLHYRANINDRQ